MDGCSSDCKWNLLLDQSADGLRGDDPHLPQVDALAARQTIRVCNFFAARERLKALGESPEPQVIRTLIEELGRSAGRRTATGLLYRDRPMELLMGR